ncbi:MAG TPA: right-handed parallel beta-helix repeat-containing protein [Paludibacter sp.]
MKKLLLLGLCSLIVALNLVNATSVSGTITTNTTWDLANSPYVVTGSITVNSGVTLKIDSGVVVKLNSNLGISVNGILKARKALFTSNVTPLAKGAWDKIQSGNSACNVTLDTCNIEYGGSSGYGTIYANLGTVNLSSTSISNSSTSGIYLNTAIVNVVNSSISACDWPIVYNSYGALNNNGGNNFSGNNHDAANISFSTVGGNWNLQCLPIPYVVSQNLYVNTSMTMKVDSGAVLKFNSNLGIAVYGTLKARKVQFTSNVTPLAKGAWSQIQSASSGSIITLDTCKVEYGGSGNTGLIYAYQGTINVNNTILNNSSNAGIQLYIGTINLKNSPISLCDWPIEFTNNGVLHNIGGNTFTGNKHDAAYIYFTGLSGSWNLELLAIPYVFYSSFNIYNTGSMIIASGNSLKCNNWIYVDGILKAIADISQKIVFTTVNNDNIGGDTNADGIATVPARSSWGGIYFRDASNDAECILRRCDVTFGGSGNRGGIIIENASPTIDSCMMANNYYGAEMRGVSNPVFTNNTLASSTVVPIAMTFDAEPLFLNNTFSFSDNQYDAIGLLGSTLGANSHLIQRDVTGIPNVTYLMLGELTIPEAYTLTIDTGIVIKSTSYYMGFVVAGALIANGGPGSKQIVFTSSKDDNHGNPKDTNKDGTQTNPVKGDWSGILFEGTSDDSKCLLNYCQVKYASMNSRWYTQYINGGAVTTVNASPTITNCILKDDTYGLFAYQASNPIVQNTEFTNATYTPIALSVSANPSFTNITFVNNGWTALGIIGESVGINGALAKRDIAGYNNICYALLGDLTINSGINVTVNPGIVIKMQNNIYVNGGFKVDGLVNDSITFTSINDDNYGVPKDTRNDGNAVAPAKGNWGTIFFRGTTDDAFSLINYCKFYYGGSGGDQGILTFTDAGNTVSNTLISDSYYYGMRFEGSSSPVCTNNVTIKNCRLDPIAMSLTSNPVFNFSSPLFASLGNGSNGIRIIEGNLSTDATLTRRDVGGIYNVAYIIDNLTIMPNTTLTLGEGVVLKFTNYYNGIAVKGALVAAGSKALPIVFTSIKDDSKGGDTNGDGNSSAPQKGNWDDVQFNSSGLDASNLLRNCIFNYGGSGYGDIGGYKSYGNVKVFDAKLMIDSCRIEHSASSAIGVYGSATPTIQNTEINNITYTPVSMSMFSNPTFNNIIISNIGINAIGVVPENYSVDATIPKRDFGGFTNITYFLYGTISVNSGTHITIPKGLVFKSNGSSKLDVSGRLTIDGTETEPVVFTHEYDDSYGNPFDTNNNGSAQLPSTGSYGLTFQDISNDLSSINHAIFKYNDRGIQLLQSSPSIQNCIFKNCNWGVVLNGVSNPAIDNNKFDNLTYTPICISLVSYPSSSLGNTLSGTTYKAIGVLSEELVQDATLEKKNFAGIENIPYYFSGNYTIGTSVTLTMKPGIVCKFADWAKLDVKRGLLALGGATPDSTIVFTTYKDDFYAGDTNSDSTATNPKSGYHWSGINFEDVALDNLCKLDHCIIKYTGYYSTDGAVTMTAASPLITNCLISENQNAVLINGASNPKINYCDFYNNTNYAVNNVNKSFDVDATNCWWGDNSGPTHVSNVGGKGGLISDKVIYSPWKSSGSGNPLLGDVSLNGSVQAYDASLVLQNVVGSLSLSSLQQQVADVSNNGTITSFDASLILQYVAGINSVFPGEMKSPAIQSDVILSYGDITKNADRTFTIPVQVENASRSISLDIATAFDAAMIEPISVTAGSGMTNRLFVYNIDKATGKLRIAIAGTEKLNNLAEVANITFKLVGRFADNTVTTLGVDEFRANETDYTLSAVSKTIQISELVSGLSSSEFNESDLMSIYPNPVRSTSRVHYTVQNDGTHVSISLFDVTGKEVNVLLDAVQRAGKYSVNLNNMKQGIYILKMISGNQMHQQKVIVE